MSRFFKILGINVGLMIVVIIALLWGLSAWLGVYTRHDERIDVPDLYGVEAQEAIYCLDRLGLKALVIDSVYVDARPGAVIEQLPVAGLPVKTGRIIYLTINAYKTRMVRMVNVLEWSSRQAQTRLNELGFKVEIQHVASEFDDLVVGVTINDENVVPGREYPYRSKVVMNVGSSHIEIVAENDSIENEWFE